MNGMRRRRPVPATIQNARLPAPIGGLNTTSPGTSMPPSDCIMLFNMVAAELGLRSRLGYREWVTGLTGQADNSVLSVLPFTGSQPNSAGDRLFATTDTGIWDVTGSAQAWTPSTTFAVGTAVINGTNLYTCITEGETAASGGPTGTDADIPDGACHWQYTGPAQVLAFSSVTANSGRGVSCVMVTPAGHFLLYCDEENGYHIYTEDTGTWEQVTQGQPAWQADTFYGIGEQISTAGYTPWQPSHNYERLNMGVENNGNTYVLTFSGTSASSGGPTGTGSNIIDGTGIHACHWSYVGPAKNGNVYVCVSAGTSGDVVAPAWEPNTHYTAGELASNFGNTYQVVTGGGGTSSPTGGGPAGQGASISDGGVTWSFTEPFIDISGPSGLGNAIPDGTDGLTWKYLGPNGQITGVDPSTFAFVTVFKNRVWFVQRDTSNAYYLGTNAIFGEPSIFPLGSQLRNGGTLVGLWNWTIDGGSGIDDRLVAVSTAGDVAIYQGTDPDDAGAFGLVGTWFIGAVPVGRKIASVDGGDLLILSSVGVMQASKLVIGNWVFDRSQYATAKIANLFNQLMQASRSLPGWSVRLHPNDNTLIITVPVPDGQPPIQLAMSMATHGWSQYGGGPPGVTGLPLLSSDVWQGDLYFGTADGRVCLNTGYVDNVTLADNTSQPVQWVGLTSFQNLGNARKKRLSIIKPILVAAGGSQTYSMQAKYDFNMALPGAPAPAPGGPNSWDTGYWNRAIWDGDGGASGRPGGAVGMGTDVAIAFAGNAQVRTTIVGFDVYYDQGGLL